MYHGSLLRLCYAKLCSVCDIHLPSHPFQQCLIAATTVISLALLTSIIDFLFSAARKVVRQGVQPLLIFTPMSRIYFKAYMLELAHQAQQPSVPFQKVHGQLDKEDSPVGVALELDGS